VSHVLYSKFSVVGRGGGQCRVTITGGLQNEILICQKSLGNQHDITP
jgi:hypothetical protein